MATPPIHHSDYHDIIRESVSKSGLSSGPYRLCPGLGHRLGPAPAPSSPHRSYEQLLSAEPLRIRSRPTSDEPALHAPPAIDKPASLDAIYELLSDGIFAQRSYDDDPVDPVNNLELNHKTQTKSSTSKKRRVPKLRTFIGGGSGSTHNVAVARRIRLGHQRLRRCVERSQSALLENLRSVKRSECDDCGVLHHDRRSQSNFSDSKSLGQQFHRIPDDESDNRDLSEVTYLKHRARELLEGCKSQLHEANFKLGNPSQGSRISRATSTRIPEESFSPRMSSSRRLVSIDFKHQSKANIPESVNQHSILSQLDPHLIPSSRMDYQDTTRSRSQSHLHGKVEKSQPPESKIDLVKPHYGDVDAVVHDIADFVLAPDSPSDSPSISPLNHINEQDADDSPNQSIKSEQLRHQALCRIRETIQTERCNQRISEKQLLNSLRDLRELIQTNTTVVARLRHDNALTAKKRHTLQQCKAKIDLARQLIAQSIAKMFLIRLHHQAFLSKQRRALIDRLTSRWPTITLRLIIRTWALHTSQASGPVRPLMLHASSLAQRVRSRLCRHYLIIWQLRTRHLTLCKLLLNEALMIPAASPFFRWRVLALRCQRLKASIAGVPSRTLPTLADMITTYRGRCRARIRHLIHSGNDSEADVPSRTNDLINDRMAELAAALHDRWLRRTAYCRWSCALHRLRRQYHLGALGQWHLLRRTALRWRNRVSQIRNFIAVSDERLFESYLSSAFRLWSQRYNQRTRTREVVHDLVYPHRLLKRCMLRWRRIASASRSHAGIYQALLNQRRRRCFRHWEHRVSARQLFRNVLGRIEALHLQLQFRRQWTRWRDRIRYMRLITRVFRDAISRWTARLQSSKVTPVRAFSGWLRYVDSQRLKRIRRVQANTAALYDGIRIRIWALKRWWQVYQLRIVFRSWMTSTKLRIRVRNRFLLKWRYLVPVSKVFRALRANVSVAKRAEALVWKAHYL